MNIRRRPIRETLTLLLAHEMNDELKVALILSRVEGDVRALPVPNRGARFAAGYAQAVNDVLELLA